MPFDSYDTFEAVKSRLDEIVDAVSDDSLSLDEALSLYEEAVGLGLRAGDLLEERIELQDAEEEAAGDAEVLDVAEGACGQDSDGVQAESAKEAGGVVVAEWAPGAGHQAGAPTSA